MANGGAIRAGRTFVEAFLDDKALNRGLKNLQGKFSRFGSATARVGGVIAGLGAAGVAAFVPAVKAAIDARETTNKFGAVFRELTPEADAFAARLSESIGRSKVDIQDSMSSFQAFFKGLGMGDREALGLSKKMQELGLDFASFHNMSDPEAMQRFISALSGSSEVVDRYGINLKAAAINAELQRQGIDKTTATATEQEKVMARLAIIQRSMGQQNAIGDAFRTKNDPAGLIKQFNAAFSEFKVEVGNALLPLLTDVLMALVPIVRSFATWAKENKGLVKILAIAAGGLAAFGGILLTVGALAAAFSFALSGIAAVASIGIPVLLAGFAAVAAAIAAVAAIALFPDLITSITGAAGAMFNFKDQFSEAWGGIVAAVKNGDLETAFSIVTTRLELLWLELLASVKGIINSMVDGALGAAKSVAGSIPGVSDAIAGMAGGVLNTSSDKEAISAVESRLSGLIAKATEKAVKESDSATSSSFDASAAGAAVAAERADKADKATQAVGASAKSIGGTDLGVFRRVGGVKQIDKQQLNMLEKMEALLQEGNRINKQAIPRFS